MVINEMAERISEDSIMDFLDSSHSGNLSYDSIPVIRIKKDGLYYCIGEVDKLIEGLKDVRIILHTQKYQLTQKIGKDYKTVAFTSESYPKRKNLRLYDNEDGTYQKIEKLTDARDELRGRVTKQHDLKLIDVLYLSHPEYGILKMFMKLSQSAGYFVEGGETIYQLDDPREGTYRNVSKKKGLPNYIREVVHDKYQPDPTKDETLHYPKFIQQEINGKTDPIVIDTQVLLGIIKQIIESIEKTDQGLQINRTLLDQSEEIIEQETPSLKNKQDKYEDLPF